MYLNLTSSEIWRDCALKRAHKYKVVYRSPTVKKSGMHHYVPQPSKLEAERNQLITSLYMDKHPTQLLSLHSLYSNLPILRVKLTFFFCTHIHIEPKMAKPHLCIDEMKL